MSNESTATIDANTSEDGVITPFTRQSDPADTSLHSGTGSIIVAAARLYSITFDINILHIAITLISFFIVIFGLFSGFIKGKLYFGEALVSTIFGIAIGGYAGELFAPRTWSAGHNFDEFTIEFTRIVISLAIFASGVGLPKGYMFHKRQSLFMLLVPVILVSWVLTGSIIYGVVPGLDFLPSLLISAVIIPTDPVLASSVIGKASKFATENVPEHLRNLLSAEAGANAAVAFPLVFLVMFLMLRQEHSVAYALGQWVLLVLLYQVVLGVVIGAGIGVLARELLKFCKRKNLIDAESMIAMYVALALFTTGVTTLTGADDLSAAFCCGVAFAWDAWFTEAVGETNFGATIELLSNCTVFIYIGATMPFAAFSNAALTLSSWRLVVLAFTLLFLRRIPGVMIFYRWMPEMKTPFEATFCAHFGPIGIGSVFIASVAASQLPSPTYPPVTSLDYLSYNIQPVTYFLVLISVLVHGLTIGFFSIARKLEHRVIHRRHLRDDANGIVRISRPPRWHTHDIEVDIEANGTTIHIHEEIIEIEKVLDEIPEAVPRLAFEYEDDEDDVIIVERKQRRLSRYVDC